MHWYPYLVSGKIVWVSWRFGLFHNIFVSLMLIWVCDMHLVSLLNSWLHNGFELLLVYNLWNLEMCDWFWLICHLEFRVSILCTNVSVFTSTTGKLYPVCLFLITASFSRWFISFYATVLFAPSWWYMGKQRMTHHHAMTISSHKLKVSLHSSIKSYTLTFVLLAY